MDLGLQVLIAVLVVAAIVFLVYTRRRSDGKQVDRSAPPRLGANLLAVFSRGIDDTAWDQLEEALVAADVGVETARLIVTGARRSRPATVDEARLALATQLTGALDRGHNRDLTLDGSPSVILVVGVNGSGKTTTIAKLAGLLLGEGRKVLLGAADTFRAAAGEQLRTWANRIGVDVVVGEEGADPASVTHDAITAARARGAEVVIIDTAGRLHAKRNLMAELGKIRRVAESESGVDEVLLVLDATTGQNGLVQVREFAAAVELTGVVLTKLDGTAKGGIVIAVERELGVPVKFVGTGESVADLTRFDPDRFVAQLMEAR